jgi:hypothetical protein
VWYFTLRAAPAKVFVVDAAHHLPGLVVGASTEELSTKGNRSLPDVSSVLQTPEYGVLFASCRTFLPNADPFFEGQFSPKPALGNLSLA